MATDNERCCVGTQGGRKTEGHDWNCYRGVKRISWVNALTTDEWAGELGVGLRDCDETKASKDVLLIERQIRHPSDK